MRNIYASTIESDGTVREVYAESVDPKGSGQYKVWEKTGTAKRRLINKYIMTKEQLMAFLPRVKTKTHKKHKSRKTHREKHKTHYKKNGEGEKKHRRKTNGVLATIRGWFG